MAIMCYPPKNVAYKNNPAMARREKFFLNACHGSPLLHFLFLYMIFLLFVGCGGVQMTDYSGYSDALASVCDNEYIFSMDFEEAPGGFACASNIHHFKVHELESIKKLEYCIGNSYRDMECVRRCYIANGGNEIVDRILFITSSLGS